MVALIQQKGQRNRAVSLSILFATLVQVDFKESRNDMRYAGE